MSHAAGSGAGTRFAYVPALDGLRGLCVVGPVIYHARASWLSGGFLTIDVFFVLSSFLITSIALAEWDRHQRLDLVAYAGRRARRLLPALLLCVVALAVYLSVAGDPAIVPRWTGSIVATLTYTANWFEIFGGVSYFEQFADPSPLYHTWSLAIEEQFYLLVPFVVIGCLALGRRRGLRALLAVGLLGALASAVWMAHLYEGGDPSRVYYGTDTRAQGLLVGIALAAGVRLWGPVRSTSGRRAAVTAGYAGMAYLVFAVFTLDQRTGWLFDRAGFLLLALAAAACVFAAMQPSAGPMHLLLGSRPMRYLGRITYGVYLYHWPIFLVVITPRRLDDSPWWAVAGIVLSVVVATVSYELIERPIVERRTPVLRRPLRPLWAASAGAVAVCVVTVGLAVANPRATGETSLSGIPVIDHRGASLPASESTDPQVATAGAGDPALTADAAPIPKPEPLRVLVVGDSVMMQIGTALVDWSQQHPDQMLVFNHARLGCPVVRGGQLRIPDGSTPDVLHFCNRWAEPAASEDMDQATVVSWATAVDAFRPDVVVGMASPWDILDRRIPDAGFEKWTRVGDAAYDDYVRSEYRAASELLSSNGARVVWMLGAHINRDDPPQNDPLRVDHLNQLVDSVAADVPNVDTIDYPAWVGPIDTAEDNARRPDGMHLSDSGLRELMPWLVDRLSRPG